ncbi:MAG: ComEC/Rec2 family competence protein [Candidatus Omnitrophica bacterium]|nr:ComEC/Rec2 family competence protein [Candidatus Omnitrophota bacterium]
MKRPLVILTVFYCLGIILAGWIRINFWIITAMASAVFTAATLWGRKNGVFLALVLFLALLIGCLNLRNSWVLSKCHIRKFVAYQDNSLYWMDGFIASQPEFKNNHLWFILRARQIQAEKLRYKCCGEVLVKMDFEQELNYGDNLTLMGNLGRPPGFGPSQGYRDFLARQGIYLIMPIQDYRQIIRQDKFSGVGLIRGCLWLCSYLEQVISRYLPALPASILSAMVLGQKRGIPWLVNNSMVKSGTVHILVVSGFNVGIVAFMVNLLLKILRFPRKARIILIAICLLIYCAITGATNPVIRATVMGLVFLAAHLLKREPDIYNSLVSAALFILVPNPRQLFDIGFQLSFISVLAIVYFYPKLKALARLEACRIKILKFIIEGCLVSFSAWMGTLVIIALNFRIISLVTVLANILIVPLATLITLCGFTLVLSGLIYPGLANLFSFPTAALITLLLNINAVLIKLPLAYIYF